MLKNLLLLSAFSAFVVVVLIGLEVYHNYTSSSLSTRTQTRVEPIPNSFDKETIEDLKNRNQIRVDLSQKTGIISEDEQGIQLTPTPIAIDSQVATQSGISL